MNKLINTCKFGITEYIKKGPGAFKNIKFGSKSPFGPKSTFSSSVYYDHGNEENNLFYGFLGFFMIILIIVMTIYAFLAVEKICPGGSERSKNTRLGLYALLIISGGSVSWIYIVMGLLNINLT